MEKLKHNKGERLSWAESDLFVRWKEIPHLCSDPQCPGDINRRKLEAAEEMGRAANLWRSVGGEMKAEKPNCYDCKFRRDLLGSAHSACAHPGIANQKNNPLGEMMAIFASVGRATPIQGGSTTLHVQGNPIGIKRGWFNHPWNFDPIWLEECNGFEQHTGKGEK